VSMHDAKLPGVHNASFGLRRTAVAATRNMRSPVMWLGNALAICVWNASLAKIA